MANYFSHKTLGTSAIIPVGLAPLYVVLGQGPGCIVWGAASVIPAPQPCSVNDDFGADPTLSPYWSSSAGAPQSVLTSVASTLDANFLAPTPNFSYTGPPGPGMFLGHVNGGNEFTAVQSVDACSGPFTISAAVEGVNPRASNSFDIALVSQDLSETLSIEGVSTLRHRDRDPGWPHAHPGGRRRSRRHPLEQWHFYSRRDRRRVRLSRGHGQRLGVRPGQGQLLGSASGLQVGTDPLYVLLGQRGGAGHLARSGCPPLEGRLAQCLRRSSIGLGHGLHLAGNPNRGRGANGTGRRHPRFRHR